MKDLPTELIITIVSAFIVVLINLASKKFVDIHARKNQLKIKRAAYVKKIISIILVIFLITVWSIVWSINYKDFLIFGSTFVTVSGVALFATWSILSNLLSSVIIFFFSPYKIEDNVKVLDGENTITGKIVDMNLFVVIMEDENKNVISYPNNILIQKTVVNFDGKAK